MNNHNFREEKYCIPKATIALLKKQKIDDYLSLYRYIKINNKNEFSITNLSETSKELSKRMENITHKLKTVKKYKISQNSRWAIGIGGLSPYSNLQLCTLHPLYEIPYIPSSALKGLIRHYWIESEFQGDETKAIENNNFLQLFGASTDQINSPKYENSSQLSALIFFDSYPYITRDKERKILIKDVITPHYSCYYNNFGKSSATDDQQPKPIEFLCVTGLTFISYIGCRINISDKTKEKLDTMVKNAFSEYGIGAKTSLGYGRADVEVQ